MAHYAEIINNKVARVLVLNNEWSPAECTSWLNTHISPNPWLQTSYNARIRGKFAGIGDEYHPALDAFVSPKPYPSWKLNTRTKKYDPPRKVPKLKSHQFAEWNETSKSWTVKDKPGRRK